jgi:hypothetical protein
MFGKLNLWHKHLKPDYKRQLAKAKRFITVEMVGDNLAIDTKGRVWECKTIMGLYA